MKASPWKKTGCKIVFDNQRVKIREDSWITPKNRETRFTVIDRCPIVAILAITNDQKILTVRQYRPAIEQMTLDIPGGGIHYQEHESPLQAAKRELLEETGYTSENWEELLEYFPDSGRSNQKKYLYLARDIIKTKKQSLDSEEFIEIKLIPVKKLWELFRTKRIEEPTMILALSCLGI